MGGGETYIKPAPDGSSRRPDVENHSLGTRDASKPTADPPEEAFETIPGGPEAAQDSVLAPKWISKRP